MENLSYIQVKKEETDDEDSTPIIKMKARSDVKSKGADELSAGGRGKKRIKREGGYYDVKSEETDDEGDIGSEGNNSDLVELGSNESKTAGVGGGETIIATEVREVGFGDLFLNCGTETLA